MKNKKGFTLIEVIAVVIIIGVLALVANPLVQNFIISSRKSSFASSAKAFLETAKAKMEMKEYGELEELESMIVPLKSIKLERGSTTESAFGKYDLERSFIIISHHKTPTGPAYQYYINLTDDSGHAISNATFNTLNKDRVEAGDKNRMPTLSQIITSGYNCSTPNINCYKFFERRDVSLAVGLTGAEVFILLQNV